MPQELLSDLCVQSNLLTNVINVHILVIDLIDQDILCGVKVTIRQREDGAGL